MTAPLDFSKLEQLAATIRTQIVKLSYQARTPHLASALSCVDILVALYAGGFLNLNPQDPNATHRDRVIFSKGHAAPALYATLAEMGFFEKSLLDSYNQNGALLAEQPSPGSVPGLEIATGSLGHGLSIGLGMALASRIQNRVYRVYALLSDGECNEGSVWEAALLASAQKLNNLVAIVDFNKWQATGRSNEVMGLEPLREKWEAFGWSAHEIDGHDLPALVKLLSNVPNESGKPVAIIAHTVKGRGVSFMEDDNNWHYRIPNDDEWVQAQNELGRKQA
jgi:transketolase